MTVMSYLKITNIVYSRGVYLGNPVTCTAKKRKIGTQGIHVEKLRWEIHIINPVDKTKLSWNNSHRRSTTVFLENRFLFH